MANTDLDLALSFLDQDSRQGGSSNMVMHVRPDLLLAQIQAGIDKAQAEIHSLEGQIASVENRSYENLPYDNEPSRIDSKFEDAVEKARKDCQHEESRIECDIKYQRITLSDIEENIKKFEIQLPGLRAMLLPGYEESVNSKLLRIGWRNYDPKVCIREVESEIAKLQPNLHEIETKIKTNEIKLNRVRSEYQTKIKTLESERRARIAEFEGGRKSKSAELRVKIDEDKQKRAGLIAKFRHEINLKGLEVRQLQRCYQRLIQKVLEG